MVLWGTMCVALGLVKTYEGLLAVRAALGLAEGGLFPGITWLITMWYQRHECGSRMAWFLALLLRLVLLEDYSRAQSCRWTIFVA